MTISNYPGGLLEDLRRAAINAHRHRGRALPPETLDCWIQLLSVAHHRVSEGGWGASKIVQRARQLEVELMFYDRESLKGAEQFVGVGKETVRTSGNL